jgi:hypothetical protein
MPQRPLIKGEDLRDELLETLLYRAATTERNSVMAFFDPFDTSSLTAVERIRATTAIAVANLTPSLTPEFVFEHIVPDASACADWLGNMVEYFAEAGRADLVASLHELRSLAIGVSC